MEEATDDMEMKERSEQEAGEQEGEEETNVDDERRRLYERMSNKDRPITRVNTDTRTSGRPEGSVPDTKRDVGNMKRSMTADKKRFIREWFDVSLNKGDGPNSTKLFDNLSLTREKSKNINIIMFRGRRVAEIINRKLEYSTKGEVKPYVDEFKELLKRADAEHQKTPVTIVEEHINVDIPQVVMEDIIDNVSERIESEVDDEMEDFVTNPEITNNELREIRGILNVKGSTGEEKIKFLKVNRKYWKDKANDEKAKGNEMK